jgi:hypothetical protein
MSWCFKDQPPATPTRKVCPSCRRLMAVVCLCSFVAGGSAHTVELPARAAASLISVAVGVSGSAKGPMQQVNNETTGESLNVSFESDARTAAVEVSGAARVRRL